MFWNKRKTNVDPIAVRLHGTEDVPPNNPRPSPDYNTLMQRHARWAANQPQASYESIVFKDDNDPKVLEFLRYLGYDPVTIEKAIITVEVGKPVVVDVKGYSASERSTGSTWTALNKERNA